VDKLLPERDLDPKITYEEHLRIFTKALPLTDSERKLILGENAARSGSKDCLPDEVELAHVQDFIRFVICIISEYR